MNKFHVLGSSTDAAVVLCLSKGKELTYGKFRYKVDVTVNAFWCVIVEVEEVQAYHGSDPSFAISCPRNPYQSTIFTD